MNQLKSIWVETTTKCNLRCRTCGKTEKGSHMAFPLFQTISDQIFPHTEEVVLTGIGEPTITDQFYDMCQITLNTHRKKLSLITNAMQLAKDKHLLDILVNDQVQMAISIDGVGRTYETIRRGAKWDTLESVIAEINNIKSKKHLPHFLFGVNFVLNRENREDLSTIIRYCKEKWFADYLCVIMLQPFSGNHRFFDRSAPVYFKEEANRILENAKKEARESDLAITLPESFDLSHASSPSILQSARSKLIPDNIYDWIKNTVHRIFFDFPVIYDLFYKKLKLPERSCPVFHERLFFAVNGDVAPCCGLQEYVLGNISETPIEKIKTSKRYQTLMAHVQKKRLPLECHRCNLPFGITKGNPNA